MSGHSKWSKIKRQKGLDDAKRGQFYTKWTREIMVAVRQGGVNPESNFRLRLAIQKARDGNMPLDNIERAIKKGSGETEAASLIEMTLEGYGPGGAAIMVQLVTDNRNRTLQDVRNIFSRCGGSLSSAGTVAWIFDPRGVITVPIQNQNADELELEAIDAGADDVKVEDGYVDIFTRPEDLAKVRDTLEKKKIPITSADMTMVSKNMAELAEKQALQTLKLMERLEELDEVQNVTTNADFPESVVDSAEAAK